MWRQDIIKINETFFFQDLKDQNVQFLEITAL